MKKIAAILLAMLMLCSAAMAEGSIVISGTGNSEVTIGEMISIPDVCDVTIHSLTNGEYALSVAAWNRPDDEPIECLYEKWEGMRLKYEMYNDKEEAYASVYARLQNAALQASTSEYKLIDVRLSVLNTMLLGMNVTDKIQMKLVYKDKYEFVEPMVRMETMDNMGRDGEWLCEVTDIPMLVERITHFVFEVPNAVLETTDPLKAIITVNGEDYEFNIR